jgi:hypothetical protein
VLTAAGAVAIGSLGVGDHVLAYDETTGTTASYPISVVHINADPETGTVVIGGEVIETTPEHPFYTLEAGWLDAEDLEPGMHVPSASGEPGEISSVDFAARPAIMYNLTVEVAHTFFVGEGEWLVHNTDGVCQLPRPRKPSEPPLRGANGEIGGTYRLVDGTTGATRYTGRATDLSRRRSDWYRDPQKGHLLFRVDRYTDNAIARRGREQILQNVRQPDLNRIRAISRTNPNRLRYLNAARPFGKPYLE